jgi:hypothetical protein
MVPVHKIPDEPKETPMTRILQTATSGPVPARFLANAPQPLDRAFNRAVHHIVSKLLPTGFDVSESAPTTLTELRECHAHTGRIRVWSDGGDRTIFADSETNYAFRAWHDYHHLTGNHEFTPAGELVVCMLQMLDMVRVYGGDRVYGEDRWHRLLWAEIVGQGEYAGANGVFPTDQMAFVRAYLVDPVSALTREF